MSKCKFTRPAFLMRVLTGELTEEELEKVFPHNYPKMYCVYNILVIDTEPEYKSFGTSRISMSDVLMKR